MRLLSLITNQGRGLLKDVGTLASLLLLPMVFIVPTILGADFSESDNQETKLTSAPLVIADYDGGEVARDYIEELSEYLYVEQNLSGDMVAQYNLQAECAQISPACDEALGRAQLADGSRDAVLILPNGLSTSFTDGKQTPVPLLFDPGGDSLLVTQIEKVSQGLAIKVALTRQIEGAKGDFTDLSSISSPEVRAEIKAIIDQPTIKTDGKTAIHLDKVTPSSYAETPELGPVEMSVSQSAVLFVFLFPMFIIAWVREEQSFGLLRRLLSTPVTKTDLIVSKLLFGVVVCFLQLAIVFAVGIFLSEYKGHSVSLNIPGFLLLSILLASTVTSLGLLIAATRLPSTVALAPMLLGGALGGVILLVEWLPPYLVPISYLMPHRYAMVGYLDLLARGGGVMAILPEAGMLLLFTLIFLGIAIWRFDPME
ncbi:MAG: ABC transporter permease [Anaerolineales bacterium]